MLRPMAQQLDLFGNWVEVADSTPPVAVAVVPAPVEVIAPLPGQIGLLDGPHLGSLAAQEALLALDPPGLLQVAERTAERYPELRAVHLWRAWATRLAEFLALPPRALADWLAPLRRRPGAPPFDGLKPMAWRNLVGALALQAARAVLAAEGGAARMPDGEPAAHWLAMGGALAEAAAVLEAAVAEDPTDAGLQVAWARTLSAVGRLDEASLAWRDALLIDPSQVDDAELVETELAPALDAVDEAELPGDARAWVPALVDLQGRLPLPWWTEHAADSGLAGDFCRALLALRRAQREAEPPANVLEHKRRLLALAPSLGALIRRA